VSDQPAIADPGSVLFAAESLLVRIEDLKSHLPQLHDPVDDEPVHQTRVVCRRLRAAFALFEGCFSPEHLRRWDRRVRRLTRVLGQARDLDVQREFLDAFIPTLPDPRTRPGLERLQLRLGQRRLRAQKRLGAKLRRFERRGGIDDLEQSLREAAVRARLGDRPESPRWLIERSGERIMALVEQLLVFEPFVEEPGRVEELHQMRIAAKHLRYALETIAPLHDGRLDAPIEVARSLQKMLGEIHDGDVWIEFLPRFIERERRRTRKFLGHTKGFRRIAQGLEGLLADRRRVRDERHAEFVELWQRSCCGSLWTDLRAIVVGEGRVAPIG
jgi:CHAD domain-containing protein